VTQSPLALAFAQHKAGRLAEAEQAYRRLLKTMPGNADIMMLLGLLLDQRGVHAEAIPYLIKAAKAKPNDPAAHYNLALALQHGGRRNEAVSSYRRALKLRPDYLAARINLGNILADDGAGDDAAALYREGLALQGGQADLHYSLGRLLHRRGKEEEALAQYRSALAIKPDLPAAINNLGLLLQEREQLDETIALYQRGLAAHPKDPDLLLNLGNVLVRACRFDEAIAAYRRLQAIAPDHVEAHHFESFALLVQGRFKEGWEAYEWRLRAPDAAAKVAQYPQARWDGRRDLTGRLLIWHEQGVGDELMFLSLLPELAREMKLLVECDARLVGLLGRSIAGVEFVPRAPDGAGPSRWPEDVVAQTPAGSLMRYMRPDPASFAEGGAYLKPDEARRDALRERYGHDRLRVGLSWHTTAASSGARRRLALSSLLPFLRNPHARFINLQYGDHADEIAALAGHGIELLQDPSVDSWADLDGFAAQVASLDLVITIDNSTAHMAGALGVPCWVMLPYSPEWRWLLGRSDCLWWPSLRLFRQPAPGRWESVITELTGLLAERVTLNESG
jgi:tetratricopeptide (TPR) repeat protein